MALSINLKAFLILIFCLSDRVYVAKKSKLKQRVDDLDKLFRYETHRLNEKIETGNQEIDKISKRLKTLDDLENLVRERGSIEEETHTAISETNLKTLSSKIDEKNMAIDKVSESLKRLKTGLVEEKKARQSDFKGVLEKQNEILKNQEDLATGITNFFNRIATLMMQKV